MLYNEQSVIFDQPGISFVGTIIINIIGVNNPIILSNLNLNVSTLSDNSNFTTIAVVSYDLAPTGILTIEATQDQAYAIVEITSTNNKMLRLI